MLLGALSTQPNPRCQELLANHLSFLALRNVANLPTKPTLACLLALVEFHSLTAFLLHDPRLHWCIVAGCTHVPQQLVPLLPATASILCAPGHWTFSLNNKMLCCGCLLLHNLPP